MNFTFHSECNYQNLSEVFENLELLLKIAPPQIKYELTNKDKGLFKQSIPIKKIKKTLEFEVLHSKISKNKYSLEIINGPLKKSKINIDFQNNGESTQIVLDIDLKLGLQYRFFKSIINEKLKSTNLDLIKRLENMVKLIFNDKNTISFENDYSTLVLSTEREKKIFFEGWWLGDVYSTFIGQVYRKLDFDGKIVVDVGSNIGDSSMFFANYGAKKVIGLEPFPKNFEFGEKNVIKNNLDEKIDLIQTGLSSKSTEIKINPELSGLSYKMEESDSGTKIKQITLEELCMKYNIKNGILKMNCEGCEYDVILNSPDEILRNFSQILIRYHDKAERLIEKLSTIKYQIVNDKHTERKGQIFATLQS